jgi:hypothetical protein
MEGAVFKNKALVTSMNPYSFTTEDKREMTGVTIEFLMTETLEPCKEGETKGLKCIKDSVDYEKRHDFDAVPGMYDLSFKMMPARNGKPQLKVVDVRFIGEVELTVNAAQKETA